MGRKIELIRIGLSNSQKQKEIVEYVKTHEIKSVIVFSPKDFYMGLPDLGGIPIRQIDYNEVIMYRTFYPLLEEIDNNHLLVVNEFMRTANRNDLTYNCLRHYLDQCKHSLVFEYFPFINDIQDFMILLDFDTQSRRKGLGFNESFLSDTDISCINHNITLNIINAELPDLAYAEYEAEKNKLFNNIGNKNPDIIPRHLHVFTGKWKKPIINPALNYVARNGRFNLKNVTTYPQAVPNKNYILLDFQHRRIKMNDFLKVTQQSKIAYISTGLSIDNVYINAFNAWTRGLDSFYAKTDIYK